MRDGRNKFNVISACGSNLSHRFSGNFSGKEQRPAMKWFLNVCISRSAMFRRCEPVGVNWHWMLSLLINCSSSSDVSLSRVCSMGVKPHDLSFAMHVLNAAMS